MRQQGGRVTAAHYEFTVAPEIRASLSAQIRSIIGLEYSLQPMLSYIHLYAPDGIEVV